MLTDVEANQRESHIFSSGDCGLSEVIADFLFKYSRMRSAVLRMTKGCPSTLKCMISPGYSSLADIQRVLGTNTQPYLGERSLNATHGLKVGMLNMLPTKGRGFGPGGSGTPLVRALQLRNERRYRVRRSTPTAASAGAVKDSARRAMVARRVRCPNSMTLH